jgi:hypothetical protein
VGDLADGGVGAAVVVRGAVREVEAEDVDAGREELVEDGRGARGRPDGGDDLGAATLVHGTAPQE